ncbi:MAG: DUF1802 family protein [Synechococcales bacterium]|nr:DUF1802 family protein [Synechococcales bacterium]
MSIMTALRLPPGNLEALLAGQTVVTIPQTFMRLGQQFALCSSALNEATDKTQIKAWARCELCQAQSHTNDPEELSKIIFWPVAEIEEFLKSRPSFFFAYLRVYWLPQPVECLLKFNGQFASLPEPLSVSESFPVLGKKAFEQRKTLQPSTEPELEELQSQLSFFATHNPIAQQLHREIEVFLGNSQNVSTYVNHIQKSDLGWIKTIVLLGHRSTEPDEGKNNYQAGTDFENIVRKSLEFLGFKIDAEHKGGAGGLDLFCSEPYPLLGECKAGKKIPSTTTEQLIKLGGMHLDPDRVAVSAKLIIGPGNPTQDVLSASAKWRVSIISPMSLQKLVELQAKYPGSVNLIELKKYLEPGQIDDRISEYVEGVLQKIKLRFHIIQVVKNYLKQTNAVDINVDTLFGVYYGSNPSKSLGKEEFHEILIELSSPLTGYLGRIKGNGSQGDRFYFLRDMPEIDESQS